MSGFSCKSALSYLCRTLVPNSLRDYLHLSFNRIMRRLGWCTIDNQSLFNALIWQHRMTYCYLFEEAPPELINPIEEDCGVNVILRFHGGDSSSASIPSNDVEAHTDRLCNCRSLSFL